jgi:hypothetical protein
MGDASNSATLLPPSLDLYRSFGRTLVLNFRSIVRSESAADLGDGWVGERRPITEDNRRHGQIAVIDISDDLSPIGMIFDVDLVELDTSAIQLRFEPYTVTAPTGGENGWQVRSRQIDSHVMDNRALGLHISAERYCVRHTAMRVVRSSGS